MEYWNHIDGISKEIKSYYQMAFIKAPDRWERLTSGKWRFYGWQSQLETLQYLERAARQRRVKSNG